MSSLPPTLTKTTTENTPFYDEGTPLRTCISSMLESYFRDLDGHNSGGLYDIFLSQVEQPLLESVMQHMRGNQSKAAKLLGINRGTLRKKLKLHGLS